MSSWIQYGRLPQCVTLPSCIDDANANFTDISTVDLTVNACMEASSDATSPSAESADTSGDITHEERVPMASPATVGIIPGTNDVEETELQTRILPSSQSSCRLSISSTLRRKTSQVVDEPVRGYRNDIGNDTVPEKLAELVALYEATHTAQ